MTVSTTFLPVFWKNALRTNERLVPLVREGQASAVDLLALCRNYRIAAIGSLLMAAEIEDFHRLLRKSSGALTFCVARGVPSLTLPRVLPPLLDAIASGQFSEAASVFQRLGTAWDSRSEYEEDFLYARFLGVHFFGSPHPAQGADLVARYAELVGMGEEPRLIVIQSLLDGDEERFEQGLEALLAERVARYERLAAKDAVAPWELATEGNVSIEGLALVALAEKKGFRTRSDYLHVPSLGRLPAPHLVSASNWDQVED